MSARTSRKRILELLLIAFFGAVVAACTSYQGDAGAERSEQQSEELQDRIMTTQIDR